MRNVLVITAGLLGIFGLLGAVLELSHLGTTESKDPIFGFALAGVLLALSGTLAWLSRRASRPALSDTAEKIVLAAAKQHGGTVTSVQIAAQSRLSFAEADAELQRLGGLGACEADVDEAGVLRNRFHGLQAAREGLPVERGL